LINTIPEISNYFLFPMIKNIQNNNITTIQSGTNIDHHMIYPKPQFIIGNDEDPDTLHLNQSFHNNIQILHHQLQTSISNFNKYINNNDPMNINNCTTHKMLLEAIDKHYERSYYQIASEADKARLKALTVNGATTWLNCPPNAVYGVKFSDLEYYTLLSLYLGAPLLHNDTLCKRCNQELDKHGYHALSCKYGPNAIQRHNRLRDLIQKFCQDAGFQTEIEVKYQKQLSPQEQKVDGVPGDILVKQWFDTTYKDAYMDVVVSNIFMKTYLKKASEKRGSIAKLKEEEKKKKYNNNDQLIPLSIECMGGMGVDFKRVLQRIADRIAVRKSKIYSVVMNQIRTKTTAILMKENVRMILSSMEL
jgi:hypothetical protein